MTRVPSSGGAPAAYEEALCVEMTERRIPFVRQHRVAVEYKGHEVGEGRVDFLVDDAIVVELKAVESLSNAHMAQVLAYLKMTGYGLGLLINFNVAVVRDGIKRIVNTP